MPDGPYKAYHPLATPPMKEPHTMHDIESLITHFLGVTWGPVVPPGEASVYTEGTKGQYSYYAISDGANSAYRVKIRTPSFPHLQVLPLLCHGLRDRRPRDRCSAASTSSWRTWTDERSSSVTPMSLSDDEIRQLDAILGHYPDRRAAAATAMRVVQARRRWLSDEALADLGEYLGVTVAELDGIATFGNMVFRKPVGRHVVLRLRQLRLLEPGVRRAARRRRGGARRRHGPDDGGRPLHAAAHRLPRRLRPRPGDDGRRRAARAGGAGPGGRHPRRVRVTSRPGLPGYSAEDRPFTRAMRADGRPATLDDYVAAGGYEGLARALDEPQAARGHQPW